MKNILIPTDLTDCTQNTLKYAISLSARSKTKLFFYHANALTSYLWIQEQPRQLLKQAQSLF
jgi:hypothetical protein